MPLAVIEAIFQSGSAEAVASLATKNVDRQSITRALPILINHLLADPSSADGKALLASLFLHFVNGPAALPPQDLFRYLHELESQLTLKRCIEACNICFGNPTIWKPEVLLASFEALLAGAENASSLPTTYMRSVLQALTLYPKVMASGVQTLLGRLINLRVWEAPRLWEGWLRAAKSLLPASVTLLLQLPLEHAKLAIESLPEARAPLKEYLWQQPPSLRNRYAQILSLVE
jgi:symplekin